jgi:hypothetical protein
LEKYFIRVVSVIKKIYGVVAERADVEGAIGEDVDLCY